MKKSCNSCTSCSFPIWVTLPLLTIIGILFFLASQNAFGESSVSITSGASIPGCEETNECYLPEVLSINVGDAVTWKNEDSAAHTVTSGTPSGGPDGTFDSSLFMSGTTFSHSFDQVGEYNYYCMVHPWMSGKVIVQQHT